MENFTAFLLLLLAFPAFCASSSCTVSEKVDCGYLGIQQEECEQKSCCWQPGLPTEAWCYHPQEAAPTYVTSARQTEGSRTILQLTLQQAVLPQYGPDFGALQVLVEPQTPQRLHVKISPTSSSTPSDATLQQGDPTARRWEVPEWLIPRPATQEFDPAAGLYSVKLPQQGQPFGLSVLQGIATTHERQRMPQQSVFDTVGTKLVFKEQYLEISTSLAASTTLSRLDETINPSGSLALPRDGHTLTLWNYDVAAFNAGTNLYGSHPFVLQIFDDGTAAGVFLLNSNGMDVELQQTSLTYRVLGGVLDFYFLLGPSPEAVIQQYHAVVGPPAMPPYWALGFHQCRWGYQTLSDVEGVVAAYSAAGIPLEVIWTDIDYMYRYRDFTTDPARFEPSKFKGFVDRLHARGQRWVPITDCGIPHAPDDPAFTSGLARGVFIKDVTGQPYLGQVWPGPTHYPDFLAVNRTWPWWKDQLQRLWDQVPYDGMWIDMNEASNFCDGEVCSLPAAVGLATSRHTSSAGSSNIPRPFTPDGLVTGLRRAGRWAGIARGARSLFHTAGRPPSKRPQRNSPTPTVQTNCELNCRPPSADNKLAFPPYSINNLHNRVPLGSKTLPMTAQHVDGQLQYDTHNLYGLSEAAATRWALQNITGQRPFVLSRSTFPGSGRFAAHWTGDNAATWQDLRWSVQGLLNSNMWGLAMAGADICGFQGDTNEELCARWIAAGAFYTFTRNHNTLGAAPQELYRWPTVAEAARKALALRYRLLPYLYTCLYRAHTEGGTVARPVFFEFAADKMARALSSQWMLGRSIMVAPVLQQGADTVDVYLPAATWHSLTDAGGGWTLGPAVKRMAVALTDPPPVFVRGGSIVALQEPLNTTNAVRRSPVTLVVALDRGRLPAASDSPRGVAVTSSGRHHGDRRSSSSIRQRHLQQEQHQPGQRQQQRRGAGVQADADSLGGRTGRRDAGDGSAAGTGTEDGCSKLLQTALARCVEGATAAVAGPCSQAQGSASSGGCMDGSLPRGGSSAGLLLGCGSLYWDPQDTLEVPGEGSVHLLFSSMVQPDTTRGWLMMAAEGADLQAACAGDCAGAAIATPGSRQGSGKGSPNPEAPVVAEVRVLGIGDGMAPAAGETRFAVWLDGVRLPAGQVTYDAGRGLLRATGLVLQISGVSRLEWRLVEEPSLAVE